MTNRKKILEMAESGEDRLLMSKIIDILSQTEEKNILKYSNFLNGHEISVALSAASHFGVNYKLFGGYDEAERMILLCYPDYCEPDSEDIPISTVRIKTKCRKTLSHRDYMGAVLNLGVKREKIGDILVCDDGAYVFCMSDIADYISSQIDKVGNIGVDISVSPFFKADIPPKKFKDTEVSVSSVRLDSVLGAGFNISRSEALGFIEKGLVGVNWEIKKKADFRPGEGAVISARGLGRILLYKIGGTSRKGRTFIVIRKYI